MNSKTISGRTKVNPGGRYANLLWVVSSMQTQTRTVRHKKEVT